MKNTELLKYLTSKVHVTDSPKGKAVDYRQLFYIFPRFCAWRNEQMIKKSYKYAEEVIDKNGDLLILLDEVTEYIKDDIKNIFIQSL